LEKTLRLWDTQYKIRVSLLGHGENKANSSQFAVSAALVAVNVWRAVCACDRGHAV